MNHVFGTQAFYHRKVMFAMLHDKRTLKGRTSISFIASPKDDDSKDPSWQTFELTDRNINNALALLDKA